MKFTSECTQLVVWDKDNNQELCSFIEGAFETEDPRVIDILTNIPEIEFSGEKPLKDKPFSQKGAGEQIDYVKNTPLTVEELTALKVDAKATAKPIIDDTIKTLQDADAAEKFETLKAKAATLGIEVKEDDTMETLQAEIDKKAG